MSSIYVFYHKDCNDGMGAAVAAYMSLGEKANYQAIDYYESIPDLKENSIIYILDFCFPKDVLVEMTKNHQKVIVLDHHVTNEKTIKELNGKIKNFEGVYNIKKSGAMITWEYFHPDKDVPELIKYVQDRDLWVNSLPEIEEVSLALMSYPKEIKYWKGLNEKIEELKREGESLVRSRLQDLEFMARRLSEEKTIRGVKCRAVNTPLHVSDMGNYLIKNYPVSLAVCYHRGPQGIKVSLRSDGSVDCSKMAESFGGGGHSRAAGFVIGVKDKVFDDEG